RDELFAAARFGKSSAPRRAAPRKSVSAECRDQRAGCARAPDYAAAASAPFTSVRRLPPLWPLHQRTIGEAMKIEEYVPTTTPMRIEKAKSCSTGPPKKYSAATESSVQPEVSSVRLNVSLIDAFMID